MISPQVLLFRKAFLDRAELLVSIKVTFFFPFNTNSLCYLLFYLLFPSLECNLLREWALPILIMVLPPALSTLPGSWLVLSIY